MRRSHMILLFGLALALRAALVADLRDTSTFSSPLVDAYTYDQDARAIAASGLGTLETPFYQPPLYAMALGGLYKLTGGSYLAPRIVQILLGAATAVLVAMIAGRIAGRRAAWLAGALFAAYGPALYFETELLPTALLLSLQIAAIALLVGADSERPSNRRLAAAGLLLGLASAARPTGLLLAGGVALWWWLTRPRKQSPVRVARSLAVFLAALLVPLLPFTIANLATSGEPILISWNGGLNFYLGNGARSDSLTAIQPGYHWDKLQISPFRDGVRASRRAESDYWMKRAFREMAADPAEWVASLARKSIRLLRARETPRNTDYEDFRRDSRILSLPLPGFGLVAPLAALGLLLSFAGGSHRKTRMLLLVVLAAVASENLLFFVADRYRLEAVPALCVLAGLGADSLLRSRGRIGLRAIAVCIAMLVLGQVDWLREGKIDEARAAIHRGMALNRAGWTESAAREFTEALRHDPNDVDAHQLLGDHFVREGDPARALVHFDHALELAPDFVDVLLAKATLLESMGRAAEAEPLYRAALAADRFSLRVRLLYGVHLATARRWDEARQQFEAGLRIDPTNESFRENLRTLERAMNRNGS